jgi:hypothetical protein
MPMKFQQVSPFHGIANLSSAWSGKLIPVTTRGLDHAFAYACFYDTSMGHYTL